MVRRSSVQVVLSGAAAAAVALVLSSALVPAPVVPAAAPPTLAPPTLAPPTLAPPPLAPPSAMTTTPPQPSAVTIPPPIPAPSPPLALTQEQGGQIPPVSSEPELPTLPGTVLWSTDVETGDLSEFNDTPWNTVAAEEPEVVTSPTRSGRYALRMAIPADASTDDYGARSEVEPAIPEFGPGGEYFFALSTYLSNGFPVQEEWQVVTQWKSNLDGSPPLELNVEGGQFRLCGGEGHPRGSRSFCAPLGVAVTGQWSDWLFRIRMSPDPGEGLVQVWRDQQEVLAPLRPPGGTMYPSRGGARSYLKLGYYRRSGIDESGTIYFDHLSVRTVDG